MRNKLLLGLIVFIAFALRFVNLGTLPPSLTWDEAAWGYNAYSLGIDGRDEFGRFLPLDYLESFGDFKPPVYAYLSIIPIKIFGLTEFAVRMPSALLGTLTVLLTYFLVKRIFINSKYKEPYALASSLILAISHWHIMLSRAAFEANIATFFIVFGVLLFLIGVQSNKWFILSSIVSFVISLYTFNTARIASPLLIFLLVLAFRKELLKYKKQTILAFLLGLILILPAFNFFISPQASLRFREVNIFSDISVIENTNRQIENDGNTFWSKILHNRRLSFGVEYLRHYFDNLNPSFLFIKGDGNPKFSIQEVGQLYLWDLPFLILGILLLFKRKERNWWLIPIWLLLAIVPAGTARETPHALRIEASLPTFQILVAYGFINSIYYFKYINQRRKIFVPILLLFLFVNFLYFLHSYFVHYAREFSGEWQYGYKESIEYVKRVQDNFEKIYITESLGRPYIYYLFYTKEDPKNFREKSVIEREALGFVNVKSFGKFKFAKDLSRIETKKKALYIDIPVKVPQNASKLKTFYLLNGEPILVAYIL